MGIIGSLLNGKVTVEADCADPERLINMCALNGVSIIRAERTSKTGISLVTDARGARMLKNWSIAEGYSAAVTKRRGGPAFLRRVKKRWFAATLILLILALTWVSNLFVWQFEVYGNENVSDWAILSELRANGVEIGTYRFGIDSEAIAVRMLSALPELRWFAINTSGSRANVLVRERDPAPKVYDMSEPIMVYADKTGVVTRADVLSGQSLCSVGDAVQMGDILVSGIMDSTSSGKRIVRALAEVYAETEYDIEAVLPLTVYEQRITGNKKTKYSLFFAKKEFKFYFNGRISWSNYVKMNDIQAVTLPAGAVLPLALSADSYERCEIEKRVMGKAEARTYLETYLIKSLSERINGEIIETSIDYTISNGVMRGILHAVCEELISAERPFSGSELNFENETENSADGREEHER